MSQIPAQDFSKFREKLFRFNGFSVEKRSVRRYASGIGAHILGDVAEVNQADVDSDAYYKSGDYIGKLGVERSYEKALRGEKACASCSATYTVAHKADIWMGNSTRKPILVAT